MPLLGFFYIFSYKYENCMYSHSIKLPYCCINIVCYIDVMYSETACADPESFARGGSNIFYKGKEDPNSTTKDEI